VIAVNATPALATPTTSPDPTAGTNGTVYAVQEIGGRIYVAGKFSWAGPLTGNGSAVNATDGLRSSSPVVTGPVLASAPDGNGGWYLGGSFTKIGKANRVGLARINATGGLATWTAAVQGSVRAIAVSSGMIYVGGSFSAVGGQSRANLAALDVAGNVLPWNPGTNGPVEALAVTGSNVLVGGSFSSAGGSPRANLAEIDAAGAATPWNPGAEGTVESVVVNGSVIYVGGSFDSIGTSARPGLAAIDGNGAPTLWTPPVEGTIESLGLASDGDVIAGGAFTVTTGSPQTNVARFEATDASLIPWPDAVLNGPVRTLSVGVDAVRLGGEFTTAGTVSRPRTAAFDLTTGTLTAWNPRADAAVRTVSASGSRLFVGGDFRMLNGAPRNNVAAIDAASGEVDLGWNANANAKVRGLTASPDGSTIYLGGTFFKVGGVPRDKVAAVSATTGQPTAWKPSLNGEVRAIATSGDAVYVGGYFTQAVGQTEGYLAKLSAADGSLDPAFHARADGGVRAIEVSPDGSKVYPGGDFRSIGGQQRVGIAELDATTGDATSFAPTEGGVVLDVELSADGSMMYCATTSNRTHRYRPSTGNTPLWTLRTGGDVQAIGVADEAIYVGGHFTKFTSLNVVRVRIGAVDPETGNALAWAPTMNSFYGVWAFDVTDDALLVGGDFTRTGGMDQPYFARFSGTP
jgi:hypothetical protein